MFSPILFTLILSALTGLNAVKADPEQMLLSKLRERTGPMHVTATSVPEALAQVAAKLEIPMGIVTSSKERTVPVDLDLPDSDVEDLLGKIVALQGDFVTAVQNGVFHVESGGLKDDSRNFLNFRTPSFDVRDEFVSVLSIQLRDTLRAGSHQSLSKIAPKGSARRVVSGMGDARIRISLANPQVRDVLDAFVSQSHFHIWMVITDPDSPLTSAGFFRTQSIYARNVSDDDQPVWLLMPWGLDPETKTYRPDWLSKSAAYENSRRP